MSCYTWSGYWLRFSPNGLAFEHAPCGGSLGDAPVANQDDAQQWAQLFARMFPATAANHFDHPHRPHGVRIFRDGESLMLASANPFHRDMFAIDEDPKLNDCEE